MALKPQFQLPTFDKSLQFFTPESQELNAQRDAKLSALVSDLMAQLQAAQSAGNTAAAAELTERIWRTKRLFGVSGSVIGAIGGLNKWQTPYAAWCEYTGRAQAARVETPAMEWGHRLEAVVAQAYAEKLGLAQRGAALVEQDTVRSSGFPFLLASVDRLVVGPAGLERVLEIKTASVNYDTDERDDEGCTLKAWGNGNVYDGSGNLLVQDSQVPKSYLLQVMLYMLVMRCPQADIAVLINTNDFRVFTIDYDPDVARYLVLTADNFWCKHVLRDLPVAMMEADAKTLLPLSGSSIEATPELIDHVNALKDVKAQLATLKLLEQEHRDAILGYIGANERLVFKGQPIASYLGSKAPLRFDKERFAAEHPDLYTQYTSRGAPVRSLRFPKAKNS